MIKINELLEGKYDQDKIVKNQTELICDLIDKFGGLNVGNGRDEQILKGKQFLLELNGILNIVKVEN